MWVWPELYVTHDWLVLISTNSEYGLRVLLNFKQCFTLWLTIKKLRELVRLWAAQLNVVLAKNERSGSLTKRCQILYSCLLKTLLKLVLIICRFNLANKNLDRSWESYTISYFKCLSSWLEFWDSKLHHATLKLRVQCSSHQGRRPYS